jgi:hypothetical protein
MMTALRNLTFAAAFGLAALGSARARACDDDVRRAPPPQTAWPAPAPVYWHGDGDRDGDRDGDHDGWRHDGWRWRNGWRARELARVQGQIVELDAMRADFYARWGWHPRKVARFEAWYGPRRAELERRRAELSWWAAR